MITIDTHWSSSSLDKSIQYRSECNCIISPSDKYQIPASRVYLYDRIGHLSAALRTRQTTKRHARAV